MVTVYVYQRKNRITKAEERFFISFLTKDEVNMAYKKKKRTDFEELIISRYFLKKILADELNLDIKKIKILTDKFGRPFLKSQKNRKFDFNVSHSGRWIVLALSNGRIGIDIEKIKKFNLGIAKECFCREEIEYIKAHPKLMWGRFYKLWTLKESFVKAIGKGLSYPLKSFYFKLNKDKIKLITKKPKNKWYFKSLDFMKDYKLAICSSQPIRNIEIRRIKKLP